MLRGQSQFMAVIYFRLFLELGLVCQTGMEQGSNIWIIVSCMSNRDVTLFKYLNHCVLYVKRATNIFCLLSKFIFQRRKIIFCSQYSWVKKSSFIHTMKPINLELYILHQPITTSEPDDDINTVCLIFFPFLSSWIHTDFIENMRYI
jgi:hypothetical protein